MKVLYTFGGMPHYLNAMLNKLHNKGVEITVITPQKGNATIGKGVKMVEGGTYRHLTAIEKKAFYGKSAYPSLPEIVREEKPDILIMGWPYFLQVFFQPRLRKAMKECRTRLVIREIPFQTPPYGKIKEYFHENPMYDENMRLVSTGTGFYLKQWLTAKIRKYCYARITGTLLNRCIRYSSFLWSEAGANTCHLQLYGHRCLTEGERSRTHLTPASSSFLQKSATHRPISEMEKGGSADRCVYKGYCQSSGRGTGSGRRWTGAG